MEWPEPWKKMLEAMRSELKPGFVRGDGVTTSQPVTALYHVATDPALVKRLVPLLRHPAFVPRVYVAMTLARLQAREEVTRALQLAMETARAGGVTLAAGAHPMLLPTGTAVAARDLAVTLHVRGLRPAGLWEVRAEARYTSGTRVETADLVSLVWRRP